MFKKLCITGVLLSSLTIGNSVFAAEMETSSSITNISNLPEVSTTLLGNTTATASAKLNYSSQVKAKNPLLGNANATATSSATKKITYIFAKVRAYNSKGGLQGSSSDPEYNSTYAGATYTDKESTTPSIAYGNHTYTNTGYKTVYHETKDKF